MYTVGEGGASQWRGRSDHRADPTPGRKGERAPFLPLRLCVWLQTLRAACDSCGAVGLRPTVSQEEAQNLLDRLGRRDPRVSGEKVEPAL